MNDKTESQQLQTLERCTVLLTAQDLRECRKSLQGIIIAPFVEGNGKGIGYNLSPSELAYSLRRGRLQPVYNNDEGSYVWIAPHDTILTLSHEYLRVPENVAGTLHSRVRNVAQGLGNTSTTLDPGWNGMMLLCISNPTKRRIKLHLSKKLDGAVHPCGLVTMVLWRTFDGSSTNRKQVLHLDNPPMRADIWDNLLERPYRFWRNRSYNEFRKFMDALIAFKPQDTEKIRRLNEIKNILQELSISIYIKGAGAEAKEAVARLVSQLSNRKFEREENCEELQRKFGQLQDAVEVLLDDQIPPQIRPNDSKCGDCINLMLRECDYLILCDEVMQIHTFIHDHIDKFWERNMASRILHRYILPNIVALIASTLLLLCLTFGTSLDSDVYLAKIAISAIPTLLSMIANLFK